MAGELKSLYSALSSWQKGFMSFETTMKIHFDEADPAGIAFSGGIFTKIHRCYEDFIVALKQDPQQFFLNPELIYPLRHIEAQYFYPLLPLQEYNVKIDVSRLSESSFQLQFDILKGEKIFCQVRSTHVCCQKSSMTKVAIPENLKQNLETIVIQQ